jgi:hypothetical protein
MSSESIWLHAKPQHNRSAVPLKANEKRERLFEASSVTWEQCASNCYVVRRSIYPRVVGRHRPPVVLCESIHCAQRSRKTSASEQDHYHAN